MQCAKLFIHPKTKKNIPLRWKKLNFDFSWVVQVFCAVD